MNESLKISATCLQRKAKRRKQNTKSTDENNSWIKTQMFAAHINGSFGQCRKEWTVFEMHFTKKVKIKMKASHVIVIKCITLTGLDDK